MKTHLHFIAGLAILIGVAGALRAQTLTDPWFTLNKIGPDVWAAIDNPNAKHRSYANAGVIIGDDGVVIVDTLTGDESSGRLLHEVRRQAVRQRWCACAGAPQRAQLDSRGESEAARGHAET